MPMRSPIRIHQDGPWSISVAESPYDSRKGGKSYSIYIKTPTHNLTLTRTASEIVDLDRKLRDPSHNPYPDAVLPTLPFDPASVVALTKKRKSAFLNTLSRLASPSSKSRRIQSPTATPAIQPSTLPTPLTSPRHESDDPFSSFGEMTTSQPPVPATAIVLPTPTIAPALAAYLTTISNSQRLRTLRVWKRFVRVRVDDLESIRVERALAIKRVRSDLAAHVGSIGSLVDLGASMDKVRVRKISEASDDLGVPVCRTSEAQKEPSEVPAATADDEATTPAAEKTTVSATKAETEQPSAVHVEPLKPVDPAVTRVAQQEEEDATTTPVATTPSAASKQLSLSTISTRKSVTSRKDHVDFEDGASSIIADDESTTADDSVTSDAVSGTRRRKPRMSRASKDANGSSKSKDRKSRKVVIDDFEMMRVLGKGCAGKVLLVKHRSTSELYALKAITKRHVLAHQELQHTLTEQAVLKRMAAADKDPFVVKLWWSFHDKENLFLVMDFHPGGDLATQLARWGRLGRDRARFYAAEIVEGVEGLHAAGVIYRDLKPENILIAGDGHIVLTDFGLSKEFPQRAIVSTVPMTPSGLYGMDEKGPQRSSNSNSSGGDLAGRVQSRATETTTTFCGTAEYLAPEVIQGLPYSYEVDWWSFGTMLYEMLTGITPFWAQNHSDMYVRVLQDELTFPDDRSIDHDTKSLLRGLLQRNPALRICEPRIRRHPYFSMIDWSHVYYKRYIPPYIPPIDPQNASDTQNFDETFLEMEPVLDEYVEENDDGAESEDATDRESTTDRSISRTSDEENTTPSQSRSSSVAKKCVPEDEVDVFDGYSFKGRHSVLLDDESESESEESESDGTHPPTDESGRPSEASRTSTVQEGQDSAMEPKTPEARPVAAVDDVPPLPELTAPATETKAAKEEVPPVVPEKDRPGVKPSTPIEKAPTAPLKPTLPSKGLPTARMRPARKEKSGIPALDRYLSDGDGDADDALERDDEDDDWDFVEALDGAEDRNGGRATTYFARGVVDKYTLSVFRKASTPHRTLRSVSGTSENPGDSPHTSPMSSKRVKAQLGFRRNRRFLRNKNESGKPKTSNTSLATPSTSKSPSIPQSTSSATASSSGTLLTPATSMGAATGSRSLKAKQSATSMGSPSLGSDQSQEEGAADSGNVDEKQRNKKLMKGAEKVLSLFSPSPRP